MHSRQGHNTRFTSQCFAASVQLVQCKKNCYTPKIKKLDQLPLFLPGLRKSVGSIEAPDALLWAKGQTESETSPNTFCPVDPNSSLWKAPEKKKQQCLCTFIQLMPFALTWHLLVLHHLMAAAENCISNGLYFIFSTWFLDSSKSQYCRLWPPPCCEMSSSSFTPWRHQHLDFFFFFANIALTIYIYLSTVHCSHVLRDH